MSIKWKKGRPVVEVYDPIRKAKRYVRPRDHGMELAPRDVGQRTLERWARELETRALEDIRRRHGGRMEETCDSFAGRWPDDFTRGRGESTRIVNRERVAKFASDFAGRSLRAITRPQAREWAQAHSHRVPAVRAMFTDAVEEGLADHNPFARLGIAQAKGRRDIVVLTAAEVGQLAQCALEVHGPEFGAEMRALVLWAAYTCLRPGEVYAARYSRLRDDTYDVREQYNSHLHEETAPKYGSTGIVYVPLEARQAVLQRTRRLGDDLMFRTVRGAKLTASNFHYAWQPIRTTFTRGLDAAHPLRQRLELDHRDYLDLHELRHFGASHMLNVLEIEPWVIAQQLRHADGGNLVLSLYGHPDRTAAVERIRRAYGGNVRDLKSAPDRAQETGS